MLSVRNRGNLIKSGTSLVLESMSITSPATTNFFKVGDVFTISGLVLQASYEDNYYRDVTNLATPSIAVGHEFTADDVDISEVTFTYTEGGVTVTTSYDITVRADSMPEGYTKKEYLRKRGYGDLSLGVAWGSNSIVTVDMMLMQGTGSNNADATIIGAGRYMSSKTANTFCRLNGYSYTSLQFGTNNGTVTTVSLDNTLYYKRAKMTLDCENGKVIIEQDGIYEEHESTAITGFNRNSGQYIYLTPQIVGNYYLVANFYEIRVTRNGVLVADFQPCTNPSGYKGLWESVGEYFVNANTSTWDISAS